MRPEFFLCLLLLVSGPLTHAAESAAPSAALERFNEGDFAQAADLFEKEAADGAASAALYYDLGRSYQQLDNTARAALNFRRALVLDPSFAPAAKALAECEADLALPKQAPDWRDRVAVSLPFDIATIAAVVLFWFAAALLLAMVFGRKALWKTGLACVSLAAAIGLGLVVWQSDPRVRHADDATVLTAGGGVMLEAPTENATKVAALPEGSTVTIHSQRGRWFYGSTPSGTRGWFATDGIVPVVPAP